MGISAMASFAVVENAGATDSETQSDVPRELSTPAATHKRRVLVGVSTGLCFALAAGVAVATTRKSTTTSQWRSADMMSKAGYTVTADTGCSDWEAQKIGDMVTASSDLDCLNKCFAVTGAAHANFQRDKCNDATLGAHPGACYCFSGCTMVGNTCWDLNSTSLASSDSPNVSAASAMAAPAPAAAGSTTTGIR